jgi:hypothetical protein
MRCLSLSAEIRKPAGLTETGDAKKINPLFNLKISSA